MDSEFYFPKRDKPSVGEIMVYLDENFTVGPNGELKPRNPGPDVIIVDYIDKLK